MSGKIIAFPGADSVNMTSLAYTVEDENLTPRQKQLAKGVSAIKAAQPLESYAQVKAVIDHFLSQRKFREAAMFVTGVCTGLRISDLCALKVSDLLISTNPITFRRAIDIIEIKTGKRTCSQDDEMLITDAIKQYVSLYINECRWTMPFAQDNYLFASNKGKGKTPMATDAANRLLRTGLRAAAPYLRTSTHTMRKTFATIANTIASTSRDIQNAALAMADTSLMLRHANQTTTMAYVGCRLPRTSSLRRGVSDFVLGKTAVKSMELSYQYALDTDDDE